MACLGLFKEQTVTIILHLKMRVLDFCESSPSIQKFLIAVLLLFPSSHPTLLALIPQTFIQNLSCAVRPWNMSGKDKVEYSLPCGISPSIKKSTHVNRELRYNMVNAGAITEFKVGTQESQIVHRSNDV